MKNENRAVFDRAPEPIDYAFDFPARHEDELPAAAPKGVARLINWIATTLRSRRNRMALLELNDDQLKDVGISRSQIDSDHSRFRMSMSHRLERHRF
jgi:uncharacterized protein YjiS (DUF1127 family)